MGEQYYVPPAFILTDTSRVSVSWASDGYYLFDGCVDRANGSELDYIKVSPSGFTLDIGSSNLSANTHLSEGVGCTTSDTTISTISTSNSVLDLPAFAPFAPIYFLGFLALSFFLLRFCFRTIVGKGYK